jgi:hypothetical protein
VSRPNSRSTSPQYTAHYTFTRIAFPDAPNQTILNDINDANDIAGFYGYAFVPSKGLIVSPPYKKGNFMTAEYPGAKSTRMQAINNNEGQAAGYWIDANGFNFGFIRSNGKLTSYKHPNVGTGTVTQLLGLNGHGIAVGFYRDGWRRNNEFKLDIKTGEYTAILPPNSTAQAGVTATSIDNKGHIVGDYSGSAGVGSYLFKNGRYTRFSCPNSSYMQVNDINDDDEIVGWCTQQNVNIGFILFNADTGPSFNFIVPPGGPGIAAGVSAINNKGDLLAYYNDLDASSPKNYAFLAKRT